VDLHVKRTKERVLTSGRIQPREALYVAAFLALLSLGLVISLNKLTRVLASVAAFLAVTYPLMKRFFAIPQAYLGIAFGFGIPMGFAAIQNTIPLAGWLMLAANICWAIAYDTEYAMVDRDDDLRLGLKTSAITFGRYDRHWIAFFYFLTILLLAVSGWLLGYGLPFHLSLAAAGLMACLHLYWIRNRDRDACFKAFLHNTWFGTVVFVGILIETTLR
jgi:4-hydroxybenzoate polyprenyltransferase